MERRLFTDEFKREARRRVPGQLVSPVHSVAPNLLDRQFQASGPNQKWAAMSGRQKAGFLWLIVLDLYSRRVVGLSMQSTMTAQLVLLLTAHYTRWTLTACGTRSSTRAIARSGCPTPST